VLRGGRELDELGGAVQTSHVLFVELDVAGGDVLLEVRD
jgi:hypothetical protein